MQALENLMKYLPANTRKQMEVHLTGSAKPPHGLRKLARSVEGDVIRAYMDGASLKEVGRRFNVDSGTVRNTLIRNNIQRRRKGRQFLKDTSKAYDVGRMLGTGLTQSEMARRLGCTRQRVSQIIKRHYEYFDG